MVPDGLGTTLSNAVVEIFWVTLNILPDEQLARPAARVLAAPVLRNVRLFIIMRLLMK
jgi:hypothetical protein